MYRSSNSSNGNNNQREPNPFQQPSTNNQYRPNRHHSTFFNRSRPYQDKPRPQNTEQSLEPTLAMSLSTSILALAQEVSLLRAEVSELKKQSTVQNNLTLIKMKEAADLRREAEQELLAKAILEAKEKAADEAYFKSHIQHAMYS